MNWTQYKNRIKSIKPERKKELEIVAQLVARRKELGLTQRELADLAGIKQPALARIEQNGAVPRIDTLNKIAKALRVEVQLVEVSKDDDAAAKELV